MIDQKSNLLCILSVLASTASGYLLGAYSYSRDWFPIPALRAIKGSLEVATVEEATAARFDEYGRLTGFKGKAPVPCPPEADGTAVILAFGQSNSANFADTLMDYSHDHRIVNFHDGRCYAADSPLLGATGTGGEFLTSLAESLLASGRYSQVVLVAAGIVDSVVASWQAGSPLNAMLSGVIAQVGREYRITHLIWHQGESDHGRGTATWRYVDRFESMLESVRDLGVDAPVFIALATRCGPDPVDVNSPVRIAQTQLVETHSDVYLAIDSDLELEAQDRAEDQCHLSAGGVEKMAAGYADAILALEP